MFARLAALAVVAALAGCAGMESAGRNASRDPIASSPPPARVVTPVPTQAPATAPLPAPTNTPSPAASAQAPVVSAAPAPPPQPVITPRTAAPPPVEDEEPTPVPVDTARRSGSDIVVPGVRERQVRAPDGDPRSTSERMEDIRAWDQCVTRVQAVYESDPMSPQLDSPEEYCSQSLGMSDRDSVPLSRTERRRN